MQAAVPSASAARVNGIALHAPGEHIERETLRQRACTELLRQAAQAAGLLEAADRPPLDGAISAAASAAIEVLLERELQLPEPSEENCRRHYAAHEAQYASGERVLARHILFAVTPGVDVVALRKRAEACLVDVRSRDRHDTGAFGRAARELSNCPSGATGGELGWLVAADCAPEFARSVFGTLDRGVLPRLVHSRFGLHVVEVLDREPGQAPGFDAVRGAVANELRQRAFITALRQYLRLLGGQASLEGVDLEASDTPLLQ